jgi:hypothetical protein
MLILLTLVICAGIILLLAHADRRDALYDSPIAPATAEERQWIALGYEFALRDGEARDKALALDILKMKCRIREETLFEVVQWLEAQIPRHSIGTAIALHELAEELRAHGLETTEGTTNG